MTNTSGSNETLRQRRNGEKERRALPRYRLGPDPASRSLYDPLTGGKPYAAAFDVIAMETLERLENRMRVFRLETLSIIRNGNAPLAFVLHRLNTNVRTFGAPIFKRVPYQVLKYHHHLCAVGPNLRQGPGCDACVVVLNVVLQVSERNL